MLNKNIKKIGGYPTPFVTPEEKEKKEYGLEYFKKMYESWKGRGNEDNQRRKQFEKNRSYAHGMQEVSKYKDLLDVEGDTSYLNLDWSPVSIIPKFVDVITGSISNQDYDVLCSALDPVAQDKRKVDKKRFKDNMIANQFLSKLSKKTGLDLKPKGFIPQSDEELDIYMTLTYKQGIEIAMEQGIEFVFKNNDFDDIKNRVIRDLIVLGIGSIKTYTDNNGIIKLRYVDPVNLITSHSTKPDFSNIQHAGEIYNITIAELKQMAGDQFSEEEYKEIADMYTGKNQNPNKFSGNSYYDSNSGSYSYDYDDFSINVLDAEFVSVNNLKYEKKDNNFGGFTVNKKSGSYKTPKKSKNKRKSLDLNVKVVYTGKYIVDTDHIFSYGLAKNMTRPKSNLTETTLSYIVYQPNIYKMISKSLVDRMIPFADQIQLAHLKIQQLLAKARPKGAAFELGSMENVSKGDGTNFSPLELQEIYDQTGNIYYRRQADDGSMANAVPIVELENGIGRDIMNLIQIYQYNLQMIRDVTGINEIRDASTPDKESLVGVQKLALLASNNATRNINEGFLSVTKRTGQSVSLRLQDVLENKKSLNIYTSSLGGSRMEAIELTKDLSLYDFGIFIDVAPDEEQKALLEQNIQISLAQKELRIEDAISVRSIKNVKSANQMLVFRRKKYQEEQIKISEQQAKMNAQVQQQSAMVASQAKQQEVQLSAQVEQSRVAIQSQADAGKMQLEYQLKEQLEQAAHQRKLEQLQLEIQIKQGMEVQKEDRKDKRNEKSDYNQSLMIEQRKERQAPLKDPDNASLLPEV